MYSNEYEEEQEEQKDENFFVNFYRNNKVLVWIFIGIIVFILLMTIITKGGSNKKEELTYDVSIQPEGEIYVNIGKSFNLIAQVKNDSKAEITWSVEDPTVVKVDNGNVTGLDYGNTIVTATYIDSKDNKHTATRNVTVGDGDPNVTLTDVSFKDGDLYMPLNETYQIALVLTPPKGYVTSEKFTSSRTSVVTVDNKGLVTAVGEGEATITFEVNGQFRKTLQVYVNRDYTRKEIITTPERISFDGELRKIKVGTVERLSYTVEPYNADVEKLIWESSDESVLTVESGKVRALKEGRAVVTVRAVNGKYDRIDVEVESDVVEVTDINLSVNEMVLTVGQSQVITPIISPNNASNKALSYAPIDPLVAYAVPNETGTQATIMGLSAGNTTVVIKAPNGIETKLYVTVSASGNNGGNGGNSGNGGSSGGSSSSSQGFKISSRDVNGEQFIVRSGDQMNNNGATAPISITVEKTDSAVDKLKILVCSYPAQSNCTSLVGPYETNSEYSFTLTNEGKYVIRVEEYNSKGTKTRTTDKFLWIKTSGSGATGCSKYDNDEQMCKGYGCSYNKSTKKCTQGFTCKGLSISACSSGAAQTYCGWCNGGCNEKSVCTSPSPTSAHITISDKRGTNYTLSGPSGTTYAFDESANKDGTFKNTIVSGKDCIEFTDPRYGQPYTNVKAGTVLGIPVKRVDDSKNCSASVKIEFTADDGAYSTVTKPITVKAASAAKWTCTNLGTRSSSCADVRYNSESLLTSALDGKGLTSGTGCVKVTTSLCGVGASSCYQRMSCTKK